MNYPFFDATKADHWARFEKDTINNILAEHVFEHIQNVQTAFNYCYQYMSEGATLRIAVPDGFNPDPEYIKFVEPNPRLKKTMHYNGHVHLFNYKSLSQLLTASRFKVALIEYHDAHGKLHFKEWNKDYGMVQRSILSNNDKPLEKTSLIIDAIKI